MEKEPLRRERKVSHVKDLTTWACKGILGIDEGQKEHSAPSLCPLDSQTCTQLAPSLGDRLLDSS